MCIHNFFYAEYNLSITVDLKWYNMEIPLKKINVDFYTF